MKNFNFSLIAAALLTGTVVLSSCSNDELPVGNEVQVVNGAAKAYSFSIPAVMDDEADTRVFEIGESTINSKFDINEPVRVFLDKTKLSVKAHGDRLLYPTKVSDNGSSCIIDASGLSFYNGKTQYDVEVGDILILYYGFMTPDPKNNLIGYYDFSTDGTKEDVEKKDFCSARMIVIGIGEGGILQLGQQEDETKSNFSFTNINSIFRQKLTFFDQDNEVATPEIQNFTISFSDNSFVNKYFPWTNGEMWSTSSDAYNYGPIKIENPDLTDGNIYFSTTFYNGNQDIIFTAYTSDGKTYTCTKNYPEGGFKNNKYYYGDAKLILESGPSYLLPTITGLTNYTSSIINSSLGDFLQIDVLDDPANFTIGGTSQNVTFAIQGVKDYNITFDNIDAIIETPFIYDNNSNQPNCLTLNLKGDNTIMTKMAADAINTIPLSTGGYPYTDLKLSCEGAEATLTLKTQGSSYCGLVFKNTPTSNTWDSDGPLDAEALKDIAADGYTVERSATSYDDATLTYVWTYTVKKIKP